MPTHGNSYEYKSTNGRMYMLRLLLRTLSRLAPGLSARLAERLFLTPLRFRVPAREAAWQGSAQRLTVGPLAVWVWGTGPRTVLLVHGWAGRGLQLGAFVGPLVEQGFRVVAFDGPGHGRSAGRRSSLPELAAAIAAMARQFTPVESVIAHSLGATATLWALARGELATERVVFLAPPARLQGILRRFSEMTGFSLEVLARMKRRIEARFKFRWSSAEPVRLAPELGIPALVIHDRDDREIPATEGRDLAEAWPGARFVATEGLGHLRLLRDPQVIVSAVGFLSSDSLRDEPAATGTLARPAGGARTLPARRSNGGIYDGALPRDPGSRGEPESSDSGRRRPACPAAGPSREGGDLPLLGGGLRPPARALFTHTGPNSPSIQPTGGSR